jgi:hypothetical protein
MAVQRSSIALVLALALCGCTVARDPDKQYTVMGQEIGERAFHDIDAYDGKVSFVGADPVRRREVQTVRGRYRAGAKSAAAIEREMVDILSRARYDDGAGNSARHAPPGIHAGAAPANQA